MADRQGFEPWIPFRGIHDFQSCAFDHSAIYPSALLFIIINLIFDKSFFRLKSKYLSEPAKTADLFILSASRQPEKQQSTDFRSASALFRDPLFQNSRGRHCSDLCLRNTGPRFDKPNRHAWRRWLPHRSSAASLA